MRNNALPFTGTTLVLGIFAAFLRWLQTMNIFDETTGLARAGAGISIALLVYCVLCAAAFAVLTRIWLRHGACVGGQAALQGPNILPSALAWVFAAVYVAAALLLMFSVRGAGPARLRRIFAALAVFGGLCFPFLPQRPHASAGLTRAAALALPLVSAAMLTWYYISEVSYQPVLWRVVPAVPAQAAATLGFLGVAGLLCGRPRPGFALFFLQLGALFSLSVSFDSRPLWQALMTAACAGMCLLLEWLVVYNLKET